MADPTNSRRIPELSTIEINSTSALKKYVDESRRLARDFSVELEWGAEEITAVLTATGKGNPWLMGVDVKWRARRVAARARRAAELQRGAAVELVRLWQDFVIQFAPALEQHHKTAKTFDFDT
ncbi:hypothetical protein Ssi03_76850 [Sphaerisporangium siamense]|uniref:Uncharacterized protein n=1 Tax=Sphaerisporangium siamense TaxID=795645 RepID=A0A7W7DGG0_9ACTN|nr:hypothetical protein [Sphaerisporangium siamense]MBB4706171.1 hypothetical protein [Sphaerisporangium siamense]GII89695.1 hypothetical protein Ssi03_76850 [Sphaerisporangium siamense]